MRTARLEGAIVVIAALIGCGGSNDVPPKTPPASAAQPAHAVTDASDPEVPWTAEKAQGDAACAAADKRLRDGLASEDDYWFTVLCVVGKLGGGEVDAFVARAREYRRTSPRFVETPLDKVPEELRGLAHDDGRRLAALYVAKQRQGAGITPHLGMGSWRGVCVPWSARNGHSDVTSRAAVAVRAQGVTFSSNAIDVLADASQDPDFFAWTNMAAHGQTPTGTDGLPGDVQAAKKRWAEFVSGNLTRAAEQCQRGDEASVRRALYFTGYAVHAVEDVASHRGRTNEEHSYNAYVEEKNPDLDPKAVALAEEMAATFFVAALRGRLAGCVERFKSYQGGAVLWPEKTGALGFRFEMTPQELVKYKEARAVFAAVKDRPGSRVRWFASDVTPDHCDGDCAALLDSTLRP